MGWLQNLVDANSATQKTPPAFILQVCVYESSVSRDQKNWYLYVQYAGTRGTDDVSSGEWEQVAGGRWARTRILE